MKRYFTIAAAILLSASAIIAEQLTPAQALARIRSDRRQISVKKAGAAEVSNPQLAYTVEDTEGQPTLYVFNNDANRNDGFIITPARDEVDAAVLGYTDSGSFDPDNIPESMRWWLGQYSEQIQLSAENPGAVAESRNAGTKAAAKSLSAKKTVTKASITPILSTAWGQTFPYNKLCPVVNGVQCPTGCVATAMAQLLKHFSASTKATGVYSYTPNNVGQSLEINLDTLSLDWDLMNDIYDGTRSEEARKAVADLMYACGVATHMDYAPENSSSNYTKAAKVLVNSFGFSRDIRLLDRNYYPQDQWIDMIYNELANNRPVLYGGSGTLGGHAFVIDGYNSKGYFHINWGWNGNSNGYFLITALNTEVFGLGGSASGFNISQHMLINLRPDDNTNPDFFPVLEYVSGISTTKNTFPRTSGAKVTFRDTHGIFNKSIGDVYVSMGVKVSAADGSFVRYIPENKTRKLINGQAIVSFSIPVDSFPAQGEYIVEPALRAKNGQWISEGLVDISSVSKLSLSATDESLFFISDDDASVNVTDFVNESPLYEGCTYIVSASLDAVDGEYLTTVRPCLIRDNKQISSGAPVQVDCFPGEPQLVRWVGTFTSAISAGDYELALINADGNYICESINVTVHEKPSCDPVVSVDAFIPEDNGAGYDKENPAIVSLADFSAKLHFECSEGYFADNVFAQLKNIDGSGIRVIGGRYIGIDAGQSIDVEISEDLSDLEPGKTYMLIPWAKYAKQIAEPLYFRYEEKAGIEFVEIPEGFSISFDASRHAIDLTSDKTFRSVSVFNMSGVEITRLSLDGTQYLASVEIGSAMPGVHIVRSVLSDGSVIVKKIVIK